MASGYFAHTPRDGEEEFEPLEVHVERAAERAAAFAEPLGMPELARSAAWLHDAGKCSSAFQAYLRACHEAKRMGRKPPRGGVDHKTAGALLAVEHHPLLAPLILGHHGGIPDVKDAEPRLVTAGGSPEVSGAMGCARQVLANPALPLTPRLEAEAQGLAASAFEAEMLLRMLYSCLVDADSLATEEHFTPGAASHRSPTTSLAGMWEALDRAQRRLMADSPDTATNSVRRAVYNDCIKKASLPPGVFRLTVPTGGGKTRSSLAFALSHALRHGHQRIIYAIPYTSIIEQTADVFRGIFGDARAVLEHHSAIDPEGEDEETERWRGLASENWDAPLVVTTTVQLFESLFSNRPGRCRKVHRIARSVLILDEVQTLPLPLLVPILDVLRTLVTRYGVTIVLCTATQPALADQSEYLRGLPPAREIVDDPESHFKALQRVEYHQPADPWSWQDVAEAVCAREQCAVILNTRKDALAVLDALRDPDALHLSTLLCPAHRRAVLAEVRRRLKAGLPCRLIATQVIEAGVDMDFPAVFRALGPLDRIVQAAGRCNREGQLRDHEGRLCKGEVILFVPAEGGMPRGDYRTAFDHARQMLGESGIDLNNPDLFAAYFRRLYQDVCLDQKEIQRDREYLRFATVAEKFRLIDQDTVSLLVAYDQTAVDEIVSAAQTAGRVTREVWRKAQQHSVAVYRHQFLEWLSAGSVQEVVPGSGLWRWREGYDSVHGICPLASDPADLVC
ncbi:MAG TPA: CRISPR-associated helicase Cas3' [Armatimonadetes bacterium]|nr:CRISPR-associated helicase Cas3' [Armatimonadota bacterium]